MHSTGVLTRVLSDRQDALLREERGLLMRLRTALARIDASGDQQQALDQSIAQLDELFLLVVVGEFNAGKSAFINALVGQPLMQEGVTPTTAVITVLEHGEHAEQTVRAGQSARHQGAGRSAPGNPHRRHAGNQRHHPRARGDDGGVHSAVRSGLFRHVRRSPVHRDRAGLHGADSRRGARRSSWS